MFLFESEWQRLRKHWALEAEYRQLQKRVTLHILRGTIPLWRLPQWPPLWLGWA